MDVRFSLAVKTGDDSLVRQNFKRNKKQVEEAKKKKRQEKMSKRLQRKTDETLPEAPPENNTDVLSP